MTKHPHRLILIDKKTWRCTLEGCSFFVHRGLEHVLWGKQAVCWDCDENFKIVQSSLKEDMPKCDDCLSGNNGPTSAQREDIINAQLALAKEGVSKISQLDPNRLRMLINLGIMTEYAVKVLRDAEGDDLGDMVEVDEG